MRGLVMAGIGAWGLAGCDNGRVTEACYPGAAGDFDMCFTLVDADDIVDPNGDYDYPSPSSGSAQYAAPLRFLDLSLISPSSAVAPNFVLSELATESRGRYAVVQVHAVERLQDLRDALGPIEVNSGYRSPGYNASVPNSARNSRHMYGDAFDLDPLSASLDDVADECRALGSDPIAYTTHMHCDWRNDQLDEAFFGDPDGSSRVPDAVDYRLAAPHVDATIDRVGLPGGDWAELAAPARGFDEGEPLRQWTAFDAAGAVIDEATGPTYVPVAGTHRVEVVVGMQVTRQIVLEGR